MDFFAAQAAARRRTALLVVYFALAVLGTVATIWLGVSVVVAAEPLAGPAAFSRELALLVGVAVGATTLGGYGYHAARLSDGGHAVARMLGGEAVDRATRDPGERRLVNVAEEMAIAAGLPVPALYVLPGEAGINAFAAGLAPDQAVVAVTRGALDRLRRDELQGVLAHEYSHVLNGDARLNVRLLSVIGGITAVAAVGRLLVRFGSDGERPRWRTSKRSGGGALLAAGLVIWIAGSVGAFFGRLIRAAVSRQREHLADAAAVQFTRNPDGLAGALAKIARAGSRVQSAFAPEAAHLFFANGLASSWLATHPPIKERIDRILPNGYLRVMRLAAEAETATEAATAEGAGEEAAQAAAVGGSAGRVGAAEAVRAPVALAGSPAPGRGTPGLVAGLAGPVPLTPSTVVASSGRVGPQLVAHAAGLLRALPADVTAAARSPAGAAALVRALLLAGGAPDLRAAQLARVADPAIRAAVERLATALDGVPREARSSVLDLALPALDGLAPDAAGALDADLGALAAPEGRTTIFEWALLRIVRRRRARREARQRPARLRLDDVQVDLLDLLSMVAWAGTRDPVVAQAALDAALPALGIPVGWRILARERVGARRLDAALDRLDGAVPPLKARIVEACAAAVLYDGRALPSERELLRAVAASLGVPVPPFVGGEAAEAGAGRGVAS
jgi:Zn-dependent protease with chaperone function